MHHPGGPITGYSHRRTATRRLLPDGHAQDTSAVRRHHSAQATASFTMAMEDVIMISVPVSDQGRALAFYVGKLGLTLSRLDESLFGIRRVEVTTGGTTLCLVTWLESMPAGCLRGVVFRSCDLQADYERLAAAGVEFDGPPFAGPDGTCQAVFHDPDGNTLVLQG